MFLIFAHLYSLVSTCESPQDDGQTSPTRICAANITVSRNPSCSLLIRETVLFPFTNSSSNFLRQIPTLADQSLEDVKATAGGTDVNVTVLATIRGFQQVQIETVTAKSPIEYVLSYSLPGGVMRPDTEGCGVIPNDDLPQKGTVWRWATGDWGHDVSSLQVTFRSTNAKRKLTAFGKQHDTKQLSNGSLRVSVTQTKGLVQVYAAEKRGLASCAAPLQCFRTEDGDDTDDGFFSFFKGEWWQWAIVGCIAAIALSCFFYCLKYCWRSCSHRSSSGYRTQATSSTRPDYNSRNESQVSEIDVQVRAPPMSMSMDERRARHAFHENEKKKREQEARKRRQRQQQQEQQQEQLRMQQRDQQRRREEQRVREQRAARQRADAQRAAAQRAAQRRRY